MKKVILKLNDLVHHKNMQILTPVCFYPERKGSVKVNQISSFEQASLNSLH